ncbi:MAG: T9SS type A sorting domain-containing protein [Flavobacteriales bacterium]|nr:T9SS type A sorting domain-containing protein [Flavobacteriales bacterium]
MHTTMRHFLFMLMGTCLFAFDAAAQFTYDARILEYTGLRHACGSETTPVLKIQNVGTATMGTCVVETWKNGLMVNSFNWVLAVPATMGSVRQPALPAVPGVGAGDVLEFRIISVNAQPDEDATGNVLQQALDEEPVIAPSYVVQLQVLTDDAPEETTWTIHDATGNVVATGGPYANANTTEDVRLVLPVLACLDLRVSDAGGNGLGAGRVRLLSNGSEVYTTAGQGDFSELRQGLITGTITAMEEQRHLNALQLMPNPVVEFAQVDVRSLPQPVTSRVIDAAGREVSGTRIEADATVELNTSRWMPGLYTLMLRDGKGGVHPVRFVRQ